MTWQIAMTGAFGSGLQWTRTETVLRPPRTLPVVTTEFPFRNNSPVPVKIISLVPMCDCLKATTAKNMFAPGESGAIHVQVPVKASAGRVVKSLRVVTDRGEPTLLRLVIEVPDVIAAPVKTMAPPVTPMTPKTAGKAKPSAPLAVTMRSHVLTWKIGEATSEKAIDVFVAADRNVTFGDLRSRDPGFATRLEASPVLGLHRIVVSPRSTVETMHGVVQLDAIIDGQKRVYSARLVVE